jgi:hypothetical protein
MSAPPEKLALSVAEEILRILYGDDYQGCKIDPAAIAAVIQQGYDHQLVQSKELLGVYQKVVEAIHLLSTPPDIAAVKSPDELRTLLSQRLDAIHAITTKTQATTALIRKGPEIE